MPKVNRRFFRKKKPQEDYDEIYALIPNKLQGTVISANENLNQFVNSPYFLSLFYFNLQKIIISKIEC